MPEYLLGIDSGCTMSKAALYTLDGREVAVAAGKTETRSPHPGWFERSADAVWQTTAGAIRACLDQAGARGADVACVACAGHGNGLYLVDEAGRPVREAILSMDTRARAIVDAWEADGVVASLRPKTMQALWPAQPPPLLAWLRQNEPDVMARARWILMCKDYVRFCLTGKIQAELTDFSGTSLLDVGKADYDPAVLEAYGLADVADLLPPLVRTADIAGQVTAEAAAQTGLAEGTPVAGGMFDIDACGLSVGMVDEKQLCMVAGTWGNNQYIAPEPVADPAIFMTSCYSIPGYYLMLEGSPTSAGNLEWFVTEWMAAERERAEAEGRSVYDLANELVAGTDPADTGIVFLPFLYGSNVGPDATAGLVGLSGRHTRGHVLRAIYEGIVFGHRTHVERLLRFRPRPDVIRLTGGAARSTVWVQIIADCFQTPVEIPAGTELGALGAAIAAAVAAGCHPGYAEAIDAMVRIDRVQEPDPARGDLYDTKYARYTRVIDALDPAWKDLA